MKGEYGEEEFPREYDVCLDFTEPTPQEKTTGDLGHRWQGYTVFIERYDTDPSYGRYDAIVDPG